MPKIPHDPDEILAVVDNSDRIIGKATRKEVHEKGLLHRETYIYLINPHKQVLLHKRADSHIWDHSSSGHFPAAQDYLEAAQREFDEELGIKLTRSEFLEIGHEKLKKEKFATINYRFVKIFLVQKDILLEQFKIDKDEVEEIRFFNKEEILELLGSTPKVMTDSAKTLIKKYILPLLG